MGIEEVQADALLVIPNVLTMARHFGQEQVSC
jgi:hypothetical protein